MTWCKIMTNGGPAGRTELLWTLMARTGYSDAQMGMANAMGYVSILLSIALHLLFLPQARRGARADRCGVVTWTMNVRLAIEAPLLAALADPLRRVPRHGDHLPARPLGRADVVPAQHRDPGEAAGVDPAGTRRSMPIARCSAGVGSRAACRCRSISAIR